MAKYGWTTAGFFERWGAEIAFGAAVVPVAVKTAQVVRAGRGTVVEAEPAAPDASGQPEAPPGAVIIGAPH